MSTRKEVRRKESGDAFVAKPRLILFTFYLLSNIIMHEALQCIGKEYNNSLVSFLIKFASFVSLACKDVFKKILESSKIFLLEFGNSFDNKTFRFSKIWEFSIKFVLEFNNNFDNETFWFSKILEFSIKLCKNLATILVISGKLGDDPGISIYWLSFEPLPELRRTTNTYIYDNSN